MNSPSHSYRLFKKNDQLYLKFDDQDEEIPARILLVAPLSDGKNILSIFHQQKKQELVLIKSLKSIDPEARKIITEEINQRYFFPKITKINDISIHLECYYWDVVTDKGEKKFMLRSPAVNIRWIHEQRIILCDSDGIKYDLCDMEKMDKESQELLKRIV